MSSVGSDERRFEERYRVTGGDVFLEIEREALGTDYQANGYTTREQADEIGDLLGLGPGRRLLDLGSGCGWPGLHLARRHGCAVVSAEPAPSGAATAAARARRDGIGQHASVVARGEAPPFRLASFDAVVHVDVAC
jgi:cyclopropane fatty-acyl-phospholipid synthase-like methyltransferase